MGQPRRDTPFAKVRRQGKADRPADGAIAQRLTFLLHLLVSALIDAASPEFRDLGLGIPAARTIGSAAGLPRGRDTGATGVQARHIIPLDRASRRD